MKKTKEELSKEISDLALKFKRHPSNKKKFLKKQIELMEELLTYKNLKPMEKLKLRTGLSFIKQTEKIL